MKTAPKFGKRQSPQRTREADAIADAAATVREWLGPKADAATVNRFAHAIARRA